jgi:4-hydroxy-3-methylbut-2-enyl diphosphate reductase
MNVIELTPYGFCGGVKRSLSIAGEVLNDFTYPRPVYLLGTLVHNRFINEALKAKGLIIVEGKSRLEMLDQVLGGTVIFSAHGISNQAIAKAKAKNLTIVDATCPYVNHSFDLIRTKLEEGFTVIYIGKNRHPETEAALAISPDIILVEKPEDVQNLMITNDKIALTNQTTMSPYDISEIVDALRHKYSGLLLIDGVCLSTKRRQDALLSDGVNADFVIVVGDPTSNNTQKLRETCEKTLNKPVVAVENVEGLNEVDLSKYEKVAITGGTSTPHAITNEIIEILRNDEPKPYKSKLKPEDYLKISS